MMLPSLLTLTLLLLAILNALLVYSIARPDRRIWPPPAQQTWQYYFVWIPTLLSFLLFIIIGVADWNSLNWPALIRWPIGGLLIVTGNVLAWGGVWQFGLKKTSGAEGSLVTTVCIGTPAILSMWVTFALSLVGWFCPHPFGQSRRFSLEFWHSCWPRLPKSPGWKKFTGTSIANT